MPGLYPPQPCNSSSPNCLQALPGDPGRGGDSRQPAPRSAARAGPGPGPERQRTRPWGAKRGREPGPAVWKCSLVSEETNLLPPGSVAPGLVTVPEQGLGDDPRRELELRAAASGPGLRAATGAPLSSWAGGAPRAPSLPPTPPLPCLTVLTQQKDVRKSQPCRPAPGPGTSTWANWIIAGHAGHSTRLPPTPLPRRKQGRGDMRGFRPG